MHPIIIRGALVPRDAEITPEIVQRKLADLGEMRGDVLSAHDTPDLATATPAPKLSLQAQDIFNDVLGAMANAEGFGSPNGEDYLALMAAISKEAMARIVNASAPQLRTADAPRAA